MLTFNSVNEAAYAVASLAEDLYRKSSVIGDKYAVTYRLTTDSQDHETDKNTYVYVVFDRNHVTYMISDDMLWFYEDIEKTANESLVKEDYLLSASSGRRYIFRDLLSDAIDVKLQIDLDILKNEKSRITLWNTFDIKVPTLSQ